MEGLHLVNINSWHHILDMRKISLCFPNGQPESLFVSKDISSTQESSAPH